MALKQEAIDQFLEGDHIARIATVRPDGRPHISPVWYLWSEGTLYFETERSTVKARNLRGNPNIAITIDVSEGGLRLKYVILEGKIEFIEDQDEVKQIAKRIYSRYMGGKSVETPPMKEMLAQAELIVTLKPTKVISLDWFDSSPT